MKKVHLYGIFAVGVCWVSLHHVLIGYGNRIEQDSSKTSRILADPICMEQQTKSFSLRHRRTTTFLDYMAPKALKFQQTSPPLRWNVWGIYQLVFHDETAVSSQSAAAATADEQPTAIEKEKLSAQQAIFLNYIRRHSADALRQETGQQFRKRKFAIAYYSCPHQLGNRLFHFMNNVLWAVITDRTVLYKYMDQSTCEQLKQSQPMLFLDDEICQAANTVQDCDAVLERTPWLPNFDEFGDPSWEIHRVDFWQTHLFRVTPRWIRIRYPFYESKHSNMTKVDQIESKLVEFSDLTNIEMVNLDVRFIRQILLGTNEARIRARKLTIQGLRYIYGMFVAEMFRLRHEEVNLVKGFYPRANEPNVFSIALHSRHKLVKQSGEYIQNEKDCLNRVLANRKAQQRCQVCAMSDRPLTLQTLSAWLKQEHQCSVIQVLHSNQSTSFSVEHGPNAGAAFARELDVCHRYGIHAVVTTSGASSSALLEVLAEYHNNNNFDGVSQVEVETQFCNRISDM